MKRMEILRKKMKELGVNKFLVNNPFDVAALTGFKGDACLVTPENIILPVVVRDLEQAKRESKNCKILIIPVWTVRRFKRSPYKEIVEQRLISPDDRIAYDIEIPYADIETLKNFLPLECFVATEKIMAELRSVKEPEEIKRIRLAINLTDKIFGEIINSGLIKPGIRESDIAAEINYRHRQEGADGEAFPVIVISGERSCICHETAATKKLKRGDILQFDIGFIYKGFCSDLSRVVIVGAEPTSEQKTVYQAVLDTQKRSLDRVAAGADGSIIYKSAQNEIKKAGYPPFPHGLGHGLGRECHEDPWLGPSECLLKNNQVISVEPGVYIPGWGGMRIEDIAVVKKEGCEILTKSPKEELLVVG